MDFLILIQLQETERGVEALRYVKRLFLTNVAHWSSVKLFATRWELNDIDGFKMAVVSVSAITVWTMARLSLFAKNARLDETVIMHRKKAFELVEFQELYIVRRIF